MLFHQAIKSAALPPATDPYFSNTSLLVTGDAAGGITDRSANAYTITKTGNPVTSLFNGPFNSSVNDGPIVFDMGTGYLTVNSSNVVNFGTSDFTIELWFNSVGTSAVLFDGRSSSQNSVILTLSADSTVAFLDSSAVRISGGTWQQGVWHHLAVSRSGTSTRLFLDGVQVGSTYTNSVSYVSGTNRPVIGAAGYSLGTSRLYGSIAGVRVVKGSALYTANFTKPTSPPTAVSGTALLIQIPRIADNTNKHILVPTGTAGLSISQVRSGYASIELNGINNKITIPYSTYLDLLPDSFTVECWVRPTANSRRIFGTGGGAVSWNTTNGIHVLLQMQALTNKISLQLPFGQSTPAEALTTATISVDQWSHIAAVYDRPANLARIFINGVGESFSMPSTVARPSSNPSTHIGHVPGDAFSGTAFIGNIDDLRVTKGIARYSANFTPPNYPLPRA